MKSKFWPKGLSEFLEDGYLNRTQVKMVRAQSRALLSEIRKDAIGLVDAWDFPDHTLNSCIGRKDGNVYESLFNMAQREPLNRTEVADGVEQFLRPLLSKM